MKKDKSWRGCVPRPIAPQPPANVACRACVTSPGRYILSRPFWPPHPVAALNRDGFGLHPPLQADARHRPVLGFGEIYFVSQRECRLSHQVSAGSKDFNREAFRRRKNGNQTQVLVLKSTMIVVQNTKLVAKPEMLDFDLVNFKFLTGVCPPLAIPCPLH